jgi:hypothetical protein
MPINKVVPHLKLFPTIFYYQFLEQGKAPFYVDQILDNFESVLNSLIRFESGLKPGRPALCCRAHWSAPLAMLSCSLSLPPTPSCYPMGFIVARFRLSATRGSVACAPPPSLVAQQSRCTSPTLLITDDAHHSS